MVDKKFRKALREFCQERYDEGGEMPLILDAHAYDRSIIGITENGSLVYDMNLMIEEYMEDEGCTYEEAVEWIEYNTIRGLGYMSSYGIVPTILCESKESILEKYGE